MFWYHSVLFGIIALFTIIELGLIADWRHIWSGINGSYPSRINFGIFVVVWTLVGLIAHAFLPFLFAGIWVAFTWLLWLIAASLFSSADCVEFDDSIIYCFGSVGRWQAIQAFAWLIWILFTLVPLAFWWHVYRRHDADLRDGVYGKNYIWKRAPGTHAGAGTKATQPGQTGIAMNNTPPHYQATHPSVAAPAPAHV
ncbi:hypothetical protein EMMF5_002723 [Cystobasidiomycetes sp. EMM_F5]